MNIQKKVISVVATAGLLAYSVLPAFAMTLEITGNNSDSENTVHVDVTNSTYVSQSNNANVENNVNTSTNTGGNEIEKTTGGDVSVKTGDATTNVTVTNSVNSNQASVEGCGTCGTDVNAQISGNNADTENKIDLDVNKGAEYSTSLLQDNHSKIENNVDADASTGKNEVEKVAQGGVEISTGDATTNVDVVTSANANSAVLGGGDEGSNQVSLKILDNNSDSENKINLDLESSVYLAQDNNAHVDNDVEAKATSGKNEVEDAAGGFTSIETGDATSNAEVDNMVNFNFADVNCEGCLFDLTAKIAGNNADTENKIKADLADDLAVFQDNCGLPNLDFPFSFLFDHKCGVDNDVEAFAKTGFNSAEEITGNHEGDPAIETSDATTNVDVNNSGNANVYGSVPEWDVEMPGFNLNLTLDLSDLLAFLHLS